MGRSTQQTLTEIKYFTGEGVNLFFKKDNINTISDSGINNLIITILSGIAEMEGVTLKDRVKRGRMLSASKGKRVGFSKMPLGFSFMIGNYDWSVPGLHNVTVVKSNIFDINGLGIAIPHDFDWTGMVNASYAIPTEEMGIENVRERKFIGICRNKEIYSKELDVFLEKKVQFYNVINDCPYVTTKVKKDITHYLDTFFDQLTGKKELILYNLTNTCKSF